MVPGRGIDLWLCFEDGNFVWNRHVSDWADNQKVFGDLGTLLDIEVGPFIWHEWTNAAVLHVELMVVGEDVDRLAVNSGGAAHEA